MTTTRITTCTCGKPTPESSFLCSDCLDDLARTLRDLPELVDELDVSLTKQRRFTDAAGSRSTTSPLPYDMGASNALHELRNELVGMVRVCIDNRVASTDYREAHPGDSCASMAAWLLWRVDGMAALPFAADLLHVVSIASRCELVIDRPAERTFAGPCDQCGRDLYAQHGKTSVTCKACGLQYDLAARREWLLHAVDDQLASATEIARALTSLEMPVTTDRIWQWKHRERIEQRGTSKTGAPLYRVGDVVTLLIAHAEKRGA